MKVIVVNKIPLTFKDYLMYGLSAREIDEYCDNSTLYVLSSVPQKEIDLLVKWYAVNPKTWVFEWAIWKVITPVMLTFFLHFYFFFVGYPITLNWILSSLITFGIIYFIFEQVQDKLTIYFTKHSSPEAWKILNQIINDSVDR